MKTLPPILLCLWLLPACLPDRRDTATTDDAAAAETAEDAAADSASDGAASDAVDAAKEVSASDVGVDVPPALGCKSNTECSVFSDACHTGTCDIPTGLCKAVTATDDSPCQLPANSCVKTACKVGICKVTPVNCDDGIECTEDTCKPDSGCAHGDKLVNCGPKHDQVCGCSDGDGCTIGDVCVKSACKGTAKVCDDKNTCTDDVCTSGNCKFTAKSVGAPCDDSLFCTVDDKCASGKCSGTAKVCEKSANPCIISGCDNDQKGCFSQFGTGPCDDGDPCTAPDTCGPDPNDLSGALCTGTPNTCDDKNPCTDDSCVPGSGCSNTPNTGACSATDKCHSGGTCSGGTCSGTVLNCDDGNACTNDSCDLKAGCVHASNSSPCSDGDVCTSDDKCAGGTCMSGPGVGVDDLNDCTTDSCDPLTGPSWTLVSNGVTCGDPGSSCVAGVCVAAKTCGDGLCGMGESNSTCAADCPASGGVCSAGDSVCVNQKTDKLCSTVLGNCTGSGGDSVCDELETCAKKCSTPECVLACQLNTAPISRQTWLNLVWCRDAFVITDGWLGKTCVSSASDFIPCLSACEGALCKIASLTCQVTNGCSAQRTCLDAGAGGCTGSNEADSAAKALIACSKASCQ